MTTLQEAIRAIRNLRAEMNVPHKREAKLLVHGGDEAFNALFTESADYLKQLAFVSAVETRENRDDIPETAVAIALRNGSLFIPMEDLVDIEEEKKRLAKEVERLEREVAIADKKLANKSFVEKAPEAVVNKEREKREGYLKQLEQTKAGLAQLS